MADPLKYITSFWYLTATKLKPRLNMVKTDNYSIKKLNLSRMDASVTLKSKLDS